MKRQPYEKPLTNEELEALKFCFMMAEEMLGAYLGHPDPSILKDYKRALKLAFKALAKVKHQNGL